MSSTSSPKRSVVRKHFSRIDEKFAKCHICGERISSMGGSTYGMRKHLDGKHPPKMVHKGASSSSPSGSRKSSVTVPMTGFFNTKTPVMSRQKVEEMRIVIVDMIVKDMLPLTHVDGGRFWQYSNWLYPGWCLSACIDLFSVA